MGVKSRGLPRGDVSSNTACSRRSARPGAGGRAGLLRWPVADTPPGRASSCSPGEVRARSPRCCLAQGGIKKKKRGSVSKAQLCFAPLQFALFCSSASPPSAPRCCPQRKLAAGPALGTPCGFVSARRDKENGTGAAAQPCPALRAWPGAAGPNPSLAPVPRVKDCGEA